MPLKRLRIALATAALALSLGGTAYAAPLTPAAAPDPIDVQAPDCLTGCSKTLQPGQRLVVAANYAFHGVTVQGSATGFGARFVVKRSTDGRTFAKVAESSYTTSFGPITFSLPGYYRAAAINDSAWLVTTATLSIR
jgi:hypothetical protein